MRELKERIWNLFHDEDGLTQGVLKEDFDKEWDATEDSEENKGGESNE